MDNVKGLVFDLDNTLLDRESAFERAVGNFYENHLRTETPALKDDVVAMMVRWDNDGFRNRQTMFARWIGEWPEVGLDIEYVDAVVSIRNGTADQAGHEGQRFPG